MLSTFLLTSRGYVLLTVSHDTAGPMVAILAHVGRPEAATAGLVQP